ncbi:MAG: ATP-grasp domain-containing protein [Eubacteriales bacterium]
MIILDRPYASKFLEDTIIKMKLPVLNNETVKEFDLSKDINLLQEKDFIKKFRENEELYIYCNSENSINWMTNNLAFTGLPEKIEIFKDKVKFRKLLKEVYPDFFFKEVPFEDLEEIDVGKIKKPFIIKPSVGFFSMGVYKVNNDTEWMDILRKIKTDVDEMKGNYPLEVINSSKFIIEENIEGEEFAVDAYFNSDGKPVILNIFKHIFSSDKDVSDRVYITSKGIIEKYIEPFTRLLLEMGNLVDLKNFPMHVEYRVESNNIKNYKIIPIEVNPMRFAGWCTTDIAYYGYGINVYEYFFTQKQPDWKKILNDKDDSIYSIIIADLPKDIVIEDIKDIDYDRFTSHFEKPLELRKINYKKHGVFAFLFAETRKSNQTELEEILRSDLKEYLVLKN